MSNSPFEIFRRNLKPLMVALTGLALFAFVVLPVLDTAMRRNAGAGTDGVVASFGSTDLTRARVDYFTRNHQSTVRFLYDLAQQTIDRGGSPKTAGFSYDAQRGQVASIGINEQPSFDGTMRSFMLASEAQKLGFDLDDSSLQVWLNGFTDGLFSNSEIDAMLMKATQNQMGRPHLYEQLRTHLLANTYLNRGFAGLRQGSGQFVRPLMTPEEEWSNFLKLNQNAVVSAYGVDVNDYMDRTNSSPSEDEILAIYDEGKDRFPNPLSPEPGFRVPYKASFEYVVADRDKFIEEEVAKLDEAAIRAEYAKRLAGGEFRLPSTGIPETTPEETPEGDDGETMPEGSDEESTEPATEPITEGTGEATTAETGGEEAAAEDKEESGDSQPEPESEETSESAGETEAESGGEESESNESGDGASEDDQSSTRDSNGVRLVVAQETESESSDPQESTGQESTEQESTEEEATEAESAGEATTEQAASEEAAAAETGEEAAPEGTAQEGEAGETETPQTTTPENSEEATEEPTEELRVETYEEVRDEIAKTLAAPAADERINIAFSDLMNQMTKYGKRMRISSTDEETKKPDLKALAEQYGLKFESIGPYDQRTITEDKEPIADSSELDMTGMGPSFMMTMYGFNDGQFSQEPQRLFAPVRTIDAQRNKQYVSWKTEETEAYVPTQEEARDEIVFAIRQREARKFAEEAAEKIADQLREGTPLADVVPVDRKDQIIDATEPFSWMRSFGFQGAFLNQVTYRVGENTEVLNLGEDFMKSVFESKTNDVIVSSNNAKSTYYVVQPTRFEPAVEELRRRFNQGRLMTMFMSNGGEAVIADFYKKTDENAGYVNYIEDELSQ